jgi:hypothetical protein
MLEFMDGFDHYTGNTNIARKWDTTSGGSGTDFPAGRFGGNCFQFGPGGSGPSLTQGQLASVATRTVGFACKLGSIVEGWIFFSFLDAGNNQVDLRLHTTGAIYVTRNGATLATTSHVIPTGLWCYIEFQATIGTANGAFSLKVWGLGASDGVWLTASGVNTQNTINASMDGVSWNGDDSNPTIYIDDVYVLNSSGAANNNFLGESRILMNLPNSDDTATPGTNLQWTPNSGSNHYSCVDDTPTPDDDTSYVSSATAGQIDTYKYPALSPTGAIAGVQNVLCARKDDAGVRSISSEYRSAAGANYDGAIAFSPNSSYLMFRQIYENDPATNGPWFLANLNGAEFGIKCVA